LILAAAPRENQNLFRNRVAVCPVTDSTRVLFNLVRCVAPFKPRAVGQKGSLAFLKGQVVGYSPPLNVAIFRFRSQSSTR
jgi:hypothetical protein